MKRGRATTSSGWRTSIFCADCMGSFVWQGWAKPKGDRQYTCTADGLRRFPGLAVVTHCPRDGMPIYRRWNDCGIATEGACPYCLGREDLGICEFDGDTLRICYTPLGPAKKGRPMEFSAKAVSLEGRRGVVLLGTQSRALDPPRPPLTMLF